MRVLLQPAFVLHRRPYLNTSLLLEAFAREHGRLALVARGAMASRSRLKGLLQPFAPLLLSWSGAGELATLTAAEEAGHPVTLPPNRVLAGLYVNELLVRL
ncbi:MAG TPA: recombination protein O N-terminal domain-containing protein, partial [Candidatus Competibacter sp.]|nr:recombination protein O N-terminal domain-containing protein [Candidatus Competibacter sp.]